VQTAASYLLALLTTLSGLLVMLIAALIFSTSNAAEPSTAAIVAPPILPNQTLRKGRTMFPEQSTFPKCKSCNLEMICVEPVAHQPGMTVYECPQCETTETVFLSRDQGQKPLR
jgi:hypothetical protein